MPDECGDHRSAGDPGNVELRAGMAEYRRNRDSARHHQVFRKAKRGGQKKLACRGASPLLPAF